MVKHTVLIQIIGATQFRAEVEVDMDDLGPDTPPLHMTGTFTRFFGYHNAGWFNISNWDPVNWISFGGRAGGNMPELEKDPVTGLAPGPRDFVLNITKRWLAPDGDPSRGVDGFRLDYAQNVPRVFWKRRHTAYRPDRGAFPVLGTGS
jgi:glycosidase